MYCESFVFALICAYRKSRWPQRLASRPKQRHGIRACTFAFATPSLNAKSVTPPTKACPACRNWVIVSASLQAAASAPPRPEKSFPINSRHVAPVAANAMPTQAPVQALCSSHRPDLPGLMATGQRRPERLVPTDYSAGQTGSSGSIGRIAYNRSPDTSCAARRGHLKGS